MEDWFVLGWVVVIFKWIAIGHGAISLLIAMEAVATAWDKADEGAKQLAGFLFRNLVIGLVFVSLAIKASLFDLLIMAIRDS